MRVLDFDLGDVVMTQGIAELARVNGDKFSAVVQSCFRRYIQKDWGELCQEDKESNDRAFRKGDERILASYETEFGRIWIITEWDRSVTTILLPEEY